MTTAIMGQDSIVDEVMKEGEVTSGSAIQVGEKVDVYSDSAGAWVPGVVTRLVEGGREVKVRYTIKLPASGVDTREKSVSIISSELRK